MSESKLIAKAVALSFLINGILFGAWVARISFFKVYYDLSKGQISLLLLLLALGAICAFLISSKLCRWLGTRHLTIYSAICYAAFFLCLGWSSTLTLFAISLFLFGAFHGAMDVAMNTWASEIEKNQNKRIMPTLHAVFSLGGAIGAASAIPMTYWTVAPNWHFTILLALLLPSIIWLKLSLRLPIKLPAKTPAIQKRQNIKGKFIQNNTLLVIALISSGCALGEGAIADWASIYMFQEIDSNQSFGAIAYSIFCAVMVVSRLSANHLLNTLGALKSIELCAVASCIGTLILISTQSLLISFTGFALLGFGFSIIMPLAFSKAANLASINPSSAIATVATFAYGGMLLGPVAIGMLSEIFSLRIAFSLFAFFAVFTFFAAFCFNENNEVVYCNSTENFNATENSNRTKKAL